MSTIMKNDTDYVGTVEVTEPMEAKAQKASSRSTSDEAKRKAKVAKQLAELKSFRSAFITEGIDAQSMFEDENE